MSPRYRMPDNTFVDTKNATLSWPTEAETLHRSRRARYFVEFHGDHVEWVSEHAAIRWLIAHGIPPTHKDFPYELQKFADGRVK